MSLRRFKPVSLNRNRRGVALVLTMMAILIIAAVVFTALAIVSYDNRSARSMAAQDEALYYANYGIGVAQFNLGSNPKWPLTPIGGGSNAYPSNASTAFPADPEDATPVATATVTTTQFTGADGNAYWWVKSRATTTDTGASRTLNVLMTADTFARFAICSGQGSVKQGTNEVDFVASQQITGPIHTNGHFGFSGHPQFSDKVTSANTDESGPSASLGTPLVTGPPMFYDQNEIAGVSGGNPHDLNVADFYHAIDATSGNATNDYTTNAPSALAGSTKFSFQGGQATVPVNSASGLQNMQGVATQTVAQTSPPKADGSNGVLTDVPNGPLTVVVNSTTVTVKDTTGTTIAAYDSSSKAVVLFIQGDDVHVVGPGGGAGTLSGQLSLGVAPTSTNPSTGNIFLDSSITYKSGYPPTASDSLGLVANGNINMDAWNTGNPGALTMDGALMAVNGTVQVTDKSGALFNPVGGSSYNSYPYTLPIEGKFTVNGSLVNGFLSNKGNYDSNNNLINGYQGTYNYDARFLSNPPPAFPATGTMTCVMVLDAGAANR